MAKKIRITNTTAAPVPFALVWKDSDPVVAGLLAPGEHTDGHAITYNASKDLVVLHSDMAARHFRISDIVSHEIIP